MIVEKSWMAEFKREEILAILAGLAVSRHLADAFDWGDTPEGYCFWDRQASKAKLDECVKTRLRAMVKEYDAYKASVRDDEPTEDEPAFGKPRAKQYYITLPSENGLEVRQCASLHDAEQEAAKQAQESPGKKVLVLESVAECSLRFIAWTDHE